MQTVIITRAADRHEDPQHRDFAESHERTVLAGPLGEVLRAALSDVDAPRGKYTVFVDWPHEVAA